MYFRYIHTIVVIWMLIIAAICNYRAPSLKSHNNLGEGRRGMEEKEGGWVGGWVDGGGGGEAG